jgi:hypothetical protein
MAAMVVLVVVALKALQVIIDQAALAHQDKDIMVVVQQADHPALVAVVVVDLVLLEQQPMLPQVVLVVLVEMAQHQLLLVLL